MGEKGKITCAANQDEWSKAVREGKLTDVLRLLNPKKKSGPWTVLCDGESFLRANKSRAAYAFKKINLWTVPAKNPDLNPIEMFWGWIRKKLRKKDLADFRNKCTPLNKEEYITRMKGVMRSHKAQIVAKSYAARFRKTCKQVVERDGAAADN